MAWHIWNETGRADLEHVDASDAVAILPIAASEQHGPHLPFGVDCVLNTGLLNTARAHWHETGSAVSVFELPVLPIGKSDEHVGFPGTLSLEPETLLAVLGDIGKSLVRNGFRRLVIVSSHGGNSETMALAARRMRVRHGMFVIATSWPRMGLPKDVFAGALSPDRLRHDNHAGAIETALMLHFAPEMVDMDRAHKFENHALNLEQQNDMLRGTGGTGFAWATIDLSTSGVLGDPSLATAEEGARIAAHQAEQFCRLVTETGHYDLSGFAPLDDQ
ncbi:MAG: creatininase family protein [Pseudomonadota bacterium]